MFDLWKCDGDGCTVDVPYGEGVGVRGARLCEPCAVAELLDVDYLDEAEALTLAGLLMPPASFALVVRSARSVFVVVDVPDSEPVRLIEFAPMGAWCLRRFADGSTTAEVVR